MRCFGAGEAWHGDRLLEIADPELLLLLAVHPVTGIRSEALADMLWGDKVPDDIRAALRKERFMLRGELRRLVPDLAADPLPGNQTHGENVVCLDTSLVSSDVHEFTELLNYAEKEKLEPAAAIEVYEAALGLYRGDLLDSTNVFNYRWMYNEDPQIALMLRSDLTTTPQRNAPATGGIAGAGPRGGGVGPGGGAVLRPVCRGSRKRASVDRVVSNSRTDGERPRIEGCGEPPARSTGRAWHRRSHGHQQCAPATESGSHRGGYSLADRWYWCAAHHVISTVARA